MIAIIDYDAGNLRSVEKALHYIGAKAEVTVDEEKIYSADAVILPGVGAFEDCVNSLKMNGMDEVVKRVIKEGKPFLGICLGLQLLFEYSEESAVKGKTVEGLGVLKGGIKQLPDNMQLKVPHMGWNSLNFNRQCPLFKGLPDKPYVYFVHSFYLDSTDRNSVAARTQYGIEFDVAVWKDNVFATQFHPEKSGETGLHILKNFLSII